MKASFYGSRMPEYYEQKWHWDLGNKIAHSSLYKALNPIREVRDYAYGGGDVHMPWYLGRMPQATWVYGTLDYTCNKYHRHIQSHDDWLPDRKMKPLGVLEGGTMMPNMQNSMGMKIKHEYMPRGCLREFKKYQSCSAENGANNCTNEKINIMEVCPEHVLEGLRERRKWTARATAIDNATYKRAMEVSDYNKGRSVSDLKLKTWAHGMRQNLRTDSMLNDDRYVPTKYPHNHRDDNVHNPTQTYTDLFGGNKGQREMDD